MKIKVPTTAAFVTVLASGLTSAPSNAAVPWSPSYSSLKPPVSEEHIVLKVTAGVNYQFRIAQSSNLPTEGGWTCDYGVIDSRGNYTAPTYQPPWGQDSITYQAPNGDEAKLEIIIGINPNLGTSGHAQYIRVPAGHFRTKNLNANPIAEVVSGSGGKVIARGKLGDMTTAYSKLPTYEVGEAILAAPRISRQAPLVKDKTYLENGKKVQAATVPAKKITGKRSSAMVVLLPAALSSTDRPKQCFLGPASPIPNWKGVASSGNLREISSKPITTGPKLIQPMQMGSIEFTSAAKTPIEEAKLGALIEGYRLGLKYPMTRQITQSKQTIKRDVWQFVSGKWKFLETKTYSRTGFGEIASPRWVAVIDGYPTNGTPNEWTSWD